MKFSVDIRTGCQLFIATGYFLVLTLVSQSCKPSSQPEIQIPRQHDISFPSAVVNFIAYDKNPVFSGTQSDTWDKSIRERGFILREKDGYHLWYTGYNETIRGGIMQLGYATSPDGIRWTRYQQNPIFTESWVEDVMVIKTDSTYYMFAEGKDDIAHMLTSKDKIHWRDHGSLQILYTNGEPLSPGPYGTPTIWIENNIWYLFYERNDEGIWLASSADRKTWKNIQDKPVLRKGPEVYDQFGLALNQVIKLNDTYYAFYHGTAVEDWGEWSTNVAASRNLTEWTKYEKNPIVKENKSSGIVVADDSAFRLYTMHPAVNVHFQSRHQK